MQLTLSLHHRAYRVSLAEGISLAIPVAFEGVGVSAFGAPFPQRQAYQAEGFIGDVARGGSCNCEVYTLNPHCCGTHTECIGHLTAERISVHEAVKESLLPARLITVQPEAAESYSDACQPDDLRITRQSLAQALQGLPCCEALIIRTLPNDESKCSRHYNPTNMPPYFSLEAMAFIVQQGIRHLLVDIPSLDRLEDGGKLLTHRIFWENPAAAAHSVTELIFVPEGVADGLYLLNLQIAPFMADAAPSHPVIYPLHHDATA